MCVPPTGISAILSLIIQCMDLHCSVEKAPSKHIYGSTIDRQHEFWETWNTKTPGFLTSGAAFWMSGLTEVSWTGKGFTVFSGINSIGSEQRHKFQIKLNLHYSTNYHKTSECTPWFNVDLVSSPTDDSWFHFYKSRTFNDKSQTHSTIPILVATATNLAKNRTSAISCTAHS